MSFSLSTMFGPAIIGINLLPKFIPETSNLEKCALFFFDAAARRVFKKPSKMNASPTVPLRNRLLGGRVGQLGAPPLSLEVAPSSSAAKTTVNGDAAMEGLCLQLVREESAR